MRDRYLIEKRKNWYDENPKIHSRAVATQPPYSTPQTAGDCAT